MNSRARKLVVRLRLALRQNRVALFFVGAWLAANAAVFVRSFHLKALDAMLVAACVTKMPSGWPGAYQSFTEVVVFGLVASVVVTNVTRKYRPEETCRALASEASGHVVVVGWTNLGRRVWEMASSAGKTAVLVEENGELVAPLVREEEPVVVGSPRERAVLEAAGVVRARVVVIATDDLESAAVACRLVRELNASCEVVVRCADDDVGSVLARTYRARSLSTSRLAASFIQAHATKLRARKVVVFGKNNVGDRTTTALVEKHIAVSHVASTSDPAAMAAAGVGEADLVVLCDDDLGENLIRVDRIRDLDKRTRIVCRAFHEDAAEILTRAPFDCVVLSTSRHAADALARAGVFREVGIDEPEARPKRALATAS
ncbi:MAG: TrkA-N:Sodium/hydrogen exchanger [Labilithrix sp.]|nr:TrkA-N:Sodium/hydrogen exchanger [Labilithrix sp.]